MILSMTHFSHRPAGICLTPPTSIYSYSFAYILPLQSLCLLLLLLLPKKPTSTNAATRTRDIANPRLAVAAAAAAFCFLTHGDGEEGEELVIKPPDMERGTVCLSFAFFGNFPSTKFRPSFLLGRGRSSNERFEVGSAQSENTTVNEGK